MFHHFHRFRRKHKCPCGVALIVAGALILLLFVPYWAFAALLGAAAIGAGVYCLLCR